MSALRKVDAPFTTVDNAVAEDGSLSYRARGVLLSLLAKPDGWAVRAEAIARGGTEGRDAILSALRELGARGHYRIVRYRDGGPGGRWKTETQLAHRPVREWADEWAANGGGPVVERSGIDPQVRAENGISGLGSVITSVDSSRPPGPENGFPASGEAASGEAASGESAAASKTLNQDSDSPSSLRSDGATCSDVRVDLRIVGDTPAQAPTIEQRAERMLRAWWDWLVVNDPTHVPTQAYIAVKKIVTPAVAAGRPERLIEAALNVLITERRAISQGTLATAITQAARHPNAPEEFKPFADGEEAASTRRRGRAKAYSDEVTFGPNDPTGGWGPAAAAAAAELLGAQ